MATLGNVPAEAYTNTVKDSFSGNGSATAFTMSLPTVTNDVRVVVENVIQDPTVAYSVSGTTLTFTSAPPTGTNNIYVVHLGPAAMTAVPPAEIADATTFASSLTVQGAFTSKGIDDNADAVALTIDSSENVLIGKTTTSFGTQGVALRNNRIQSTNDGGSPLELNRLTSDGDIALFQKDGTTVGTIGTNGSTLYIGSTEGADAYIGFGNQIIRPVTSSGASRDNAIDLGYNGMRFSDLYLSDGIYLGGVGSANKLEDYEEGTHSATFAMNGSGSISMLRQNLAYIKVGRLVTVTGEVSVSSVSSPVGSMTMTLPFTISATGTARDTFIGSKPVAYRVPHNQDNTPVIIGNTVNAQVTFLYEQDNAPFADYTPAANATFNISFSYLTTS